MATFYHCSICGNMLEAIHDSGVIPVCCGQPMEKLEPESTDGAHEKHVPVCSKNGNVLTVKVGEQPHPMEDAHYIEWISLCTNKGNYRKALYPGDKSEACFMLSEDEHPVKVYAYCNIHGLWVAK